MNPVFMEWRQIVRSLVPWLCAAHASLTNEMEPHDHKPTMLVKNIRRQLMNENYDYMETESEEAFPVPVNHALEREHKMRHTSEHYFQNDKDNELDSNINDHFIPQANALTANDVEDGSHTTVQKDLLYYVDDDRLTKEAEAPENVDVTTSPKVKYKVLKVKQAHPNRRSDSFRRFIQEEGGEGVALITLDEAPFPEFRLPRTRRQYMMDSHDPDSDADEAPSPGGEQRFGSVNDGSYNYDSDSVAIRNVHLPTP